MSLHGVNSILTRNTGVLSVDTISTTPYTDQKPGTSGLRKQTKVFLEKQNYLENFIQSIFDVLPEKELHGSTLVVAGDGRYYSTHAIQVIAKIAAANGIRRLWVGKGGLASTPAVSGVIRRREGGCAYGGIILTASHNPGGPDGDFGIKYNTSNGGPAPEGITEAIYSQSKNINQIRICSALPEVDLNTVGRNLFWAGDDTSVDAEFEVEVFDATEDYAELIDECFDIASLQKLMKHPQFSLVFDAMHGVAGPFAKKIFYDLLKASQQSVTVLNGDPKPDFGGGHPDPNLKYADQLVEMLGLSSSDGTPLDLHEQQQKKLPYFGAAADGDADRNMILGRQFFVTPSDSVAIIASKASTIKFIREAGGLKGVARSMPTSAALDEVAKKLGIPFFEVPTGWKFFGNLMDSKEVYGKEDYTPFLCGEESFGTGSNHIREKDGLWAVLAWLSILADVNQTTSDDQPLISVRDVVEQFWKEYGRFYYTRYDYEGVDSDKADKFMEALKSIPGEGASFGNFTVKDWSVFDYRDPVDDSIAKNQGIRFYFTDGSRIVFRLSGTGSVGATIRMYLEKYEPSNTTLPTPVAVRDLVAAALQLSNMEAITGRKEPTVIT